ncbi:MAG: CPBP family intramembrane metalloprotease [Chloroflexi bacterium]|nr:CPBP family intramembrane metalloprotease [Chloroflexota bacterium]
MSQSTPSRQSHFVRRLIDRHPYLASVLLPIVLWSIPLGLFFLVRLALQLHLSPFGNARLPLLLTVLVGEPLLVLEVVALVSWLGWWSDAGFTHGVSGKGIVLCIVPFVLIALPVLPALALGFLRAPFFIVIVVVILSILVGFVEEGTFRGMMVRILLPKGILRAVLLSSVLFACLHAINLLYGLPWLYVLGQFMLAAGMGILFAAVRLRTGSLWPSILLHALRDAPGLIILAINPSLALSASPAGIIATGILSLLFVLYAVYLLRPSQLAKLRIAYGLAPAPMPTLPYEGPPSLTEYGDVQHTNSQPL